MMATYASARETLVLRSAEMAGNRYHQRAWYGEFHDPYFFNSTSPYISRMMVPRMVPKFSEE
jgi:hypothetical protein